MTLLEIVERLCSVTQMQAEIIRKQTEIIEQAKIADAVADQRMTEESLNDSDALAVKELYDLWNGSKQHVIGDRVRDDGHLYKWCQPLSSGNLRAA